MTKHLCVGGPLHGTWQDFGEDESKYVFVLNPAIKWPVKVPKDLTHLYVHRDLMAKRHVAISLIEDLFQKELTVAALMRI